MIPGRLRQAAAPVGSPSASSPGSGSASDGEAARFSLLVAASRVTGFVRMLAGFAVLGTSTQLGNVVQSANLVPTLLFELLAAGALGAVFIPMLVDEERRFVGPDGEFRSRLAGTVILYLGGILVVVVAVALLARGRVTDYLLGNVPAADRQAAQLLGTYLLWWFLPQVFAYLANAVAVALLNARGRFWAGAVCPLVNNVVVAATLGALAVMRRGDVSLPLSGTEKLLIGGGFTAGVVAMAAVPLLDALNHAAPLGRPLPPRSASLRELGRAVWWAVLFLGAAQVPMLAVLPLTNSVDGNTQVWILTWQILLLPHALLASPIYTTRLPALSSAHQQVETRAFAELAGASVRSVVTTGALAGGLLAALSPQVAQAVSIGAAANSTATVAWAVAGFAVGVPAYALWMTLVRISYATADARTPAVVAVAVAVAAVIGFLAVNALVDGEGRVGAFALVWSLTIAVGALVLAVRLRHLLGGRAQFPGSWVRRRTLATGVAAVAAAGLGLTLHPQAAVVAVAVGAVGGALGLGVFLTIDRTLGGPSFAVTLGSFGGAPDGERAAENRS